jgi:RNA 2',3'-cyclic 3'-phosphodiesterase
MEKSFHKLFVGIKIDPDNYFMDFIYRIREELSGEEIRWSKPSNYHITLKFIGDVDSLQSGVIERKLALIPSEFESFELAVIGLGVFRSVSFPRVLYARVDAPDIIFKLNKHLIHLLSDSSELGVNDNFSPHVTLGRMKKFSNRNALRRILDEHRTHELLRIKVTEIILYESLIKNESREYVALSRFELDN